MVELVLAFQSVVLELETLGKTLPRDGVNIPPGVTVPPAVQPGAGGRPDVSEEEFLAMILAAIEPGGGTKVTVLGGDTPGGARGGAKPPPLPTGPLESLEDAFAFGEAKAANEWFSMVEQSAASGYSLRGLSEIAAEPEARLASWLLAQVGEPEQLDAQARPILADFELGGWAAAASLWPGGEPALRRALSDALKEAPAAAASKSAAAAVHLAQHGSAGFSAEHLAGGLQSCMSAARAVFSHPERRETNPRAVAALTLSLVNLCIVWMEVAVDRERGPRSFFEAKALASVLQPALLFTQQPVPRRAPGFFAAATPVGLFLVATALHADAVGFCADVGLSAVLARSDVNEAAAAPTKAKKGFSPASRAAAEDKAPALLAELNALDLENVLSEELRATASERSEARARLIAFAAAAFGVNGATDTYDRCVFHRCACTYKAAKQCADAFFCAPLPALRRADVVLPLSMGARPNAQLVAPLAVQIAQSTAAVSHCSPRQCLARRARSRQGSSARHPRAGRTADRKHAFLDILCCGGRPALTSAAPALHSPFPGPHSGPDGAGSRAKLRSVDGIGAAHPRAQRRCPGVD